MIMTGCERAVEPDNNKPIEEEVTENNEDNKNTEELPDEKLATIADYYPFNENIKMEYEGIGNEFAEQTTFIEFIEDNRAQLKIFNPGTVVVKVIENKDGELREVFREGEFYHIENMIDTTNENNNIILKEPLKVGTSWNIEEGYKRSITGIDVDIETPYKKLKALEVTTELGDGKKQFDYYVKDIGHVASIYRDGEFEVKTLLEELERESYETEIRFYYPMYEDIKTAYVERDIEFNTNDQIESILEKNLQNTNTDKLIAPISKNTRINSIKLDRGNKIVRVDFSKELLTEMNAGSALEIEILKSIVNTLGNYYGVDKVYISTDSKPYGSGHFELGEDEFFTVDYENIEKFD